MKKYILILATLALAAVSCDKNENPVFNDADAFVAFDKGSFSITETKGQIEIPVTLVSLAGLETTISYEAEDGTAKAGVNFTLVDGTATLTFTKDAPTQSIKVNIIDPEVVYDAEGVRTSGKYTGDLSFTLKFKSTGDVNAGRESTCKITIEDIDHPLTFILGDYAASADSWWRGHFDWDITLVKDPDDITKVWIYNLEPYLGSYGYKANAGYNIYYGFVSEDKTQITVPACQETGYQTWCLIGFDTDDPDSDDAGMTDIIFNINADGSKLTMPYGWGVAVTSAGESWGNIYDGGIEFTKK